MLTVGSPFLVVRKAILHKGLREQYRFVRVDGLG